MPDEQRLEELRRALYRPGSGGDAVRTYLEAAPAATAATPAAPSGAARTPTAPAPRAVEPSATVQPRGADARARRGVVTAVIALLVLSLASATAPARPPMLPTPRAGAFAASVAVLAPPVTVADADSGRSTVWESVRTTSVYGVAPGADAGSAAGLVRVEADLHRTDASRAGATLTVFVACRGPSAQVLIFTEVQDFDQGYAAQLASRQVPCSGITAVRYRPPRGIIATAVALTGGGVRPIAFSAVEGL